MRELARRMLLKLPFAGAVIPMLSRAAVYKEERKKFTSLDVKQSSRMLLMAHYSDRADEGWSLNGRITPWRVAAISIDLAYLPPEDYLVGGWTLPDLAHIAAWKEVEYPVAYMDNGWAVDANGEWIELDTGSYAPVTVTDCLFNNSRPNLFTENKNYGAWKGGITYTSVDANQIED